MILISGVFNNYIVPAALSRPMVIGAGCIVAIPALEMAKCAYQDYNEIQRYNIPDAAETESDKSNRLAKKEKLKNVMFIRGLGALILGACALNQFPGSGAVGLLGYVTYSHFNWKNEIKNTNPCISMVMPGFFIQIISQHKKQIAKAMISGVTLAASAIGSFFYKIAARVGHVGLAILHAIRSTVKAILTPFKMARNLLKIFKPFIRHPLLGLGLIAGIVCLIGCVKYSHHLTGAASLMSKAVSQIAKGLFYAGSLAVQGIGKVAKPLGTVLYFVPSVFMKTVHGIRSVVYFIFHPLKALGLAKETVQPA